jgi:hypothetical protein
LEGCRFLYEHSNNFTLSGAADFRQRLSKAQKAIMRLQVEIGWRAGQGSFDLSFGQFVIVKRFLVLKNPQ